MKSTRKRWAGHVACIRERRNEYRVLMLEAMRTNGISESRRKDNVKMDLKYDGKGELDLFY
jgi:hypothetical protein